jgi:hypothetical protein
MRTLLLVMAGFAGCSKQPKAPDADGARAAYTARAGKIATFETAVMTGLTALDLKLENVERATGEAGAVGSSVKLTDADEKSVKLSHDVFGGCDAWTGKPGNVHPDEPQALRLDGRRIGWGIYQIADGEAWHPAIQVMWTVPGRAHLELAIEMCFTLDSP